MSHPYILIWELFLTMSTSIWLFSQHPFSKKSAKPDGLSASQPIIIRSDVIIVSSKKQSTTGKQIKGPYAKTSRRGRDLGPTLRACLRSSRPAKSSRSKQREKKGSVCPPRKQKPNMSGGEFGQKMAHSCDNVVSWRWTASREVVASGKQKRPELSIRG